MENFTRHADNFRCNFIKDCFLGLKFNFCSWICHFDQRKFGQFASTTLNLLLFVKTQLMLTKPGYETSSMNRINKHFYIVESYKTFIYHNDMYKFSSWAASSSVIEYFAKAIANKKQKYVMLWFHSAKYRYKFKYTIEIHLKSPNLCRCKSTQILFLKTKCWIF